MSNSTGLKVDIKTTKNSVSIQPDGSVLIKDTVIGEIIKSGVSSLSSTNAKSGEIQPMITISIT